MSHLARLNNSPVWSICWKERATTGWKSHSHTTGTPRRREAEVIHEAWKQDRLARRHKLVLDVPLSQLAEEYLEHEKARRAASWYRNQSYDLKGIILPYFDGRMVGEINKADVIAFQTSEAGRVAPRTVNIYMGMLSKVFAFGIEAGRASINPCKGIPRLREALGRLPRWLTHEECDSLLREAQAPYLKAFITLGCYAGLRSGEMRNLRGGDVDMERGILTVQSSVSFSPKSRRVRTVPMHPVVKALFEGMDAPAPDGLWFPSERKAGSPRDNFRKAFASAVQRAGLPGRVTPHTLRHTFAAWLAQAGVDLLSIRDLLGHTDTATTLIYTHLSPNRYVTAIHKI